jgi:hypothetical protein
MANEIAQYVHEHTRDFYVKLQHSDEMGQKVISKVFLKTNERTNKSSKKIIEFDMIGNDDTKYLWGSAFRTNFKGIKAEFLNQIAEDTWRYIVKKNKKIMGRYKRESANILHERKLTQLAVQMQGIARAGANRSERALLAKKKKREAKYAQSNSAMAYGSLAEATAQGLNKYQSVGMNAGDKY